VEINELKKIIESLLFVSEVPLPIKQITWIIHESTPDEVHQALLILQEELNGLNRSFQLVEIAEGFQLVTRPDYHKWAKELYKTVTTTRISRAALEALAIIAYKQPVTRTEIEAIRGVDVSNLIQSLLEKKMIRILGRAEVVGRPLLYGTSQEFLVHFGLKSLLDLPRVSEIQELAGDKLTPELMKEMEGELRRREAKLGIAPEQPVTESANPETSSPSMEAPSTFEEPT
jgi:segregation and condensation protein B